MNTRLVSSVSAVAILLAASVAGAIVSPTDSFPIPGGVYESANGTPYGTVPVEMISMSLVSPLSTPGQVLPSPGQTFRVDSFFDVFFEVSLGGNFMVDSFFDVFTEISIGDNGGGSGDTRSFDTEILSMSLTGSPLGVLVRESHTMPSQGQHMVQRLPNGAFNVDSFFDVWTEVSVDDGRNWTPADAPMRLNLDRILPEPATFVVLLGGALLGLIRRR